MVQQVKCVCGASMKSRVQICNTSVKSWAWLLTLVASALEEDGDLGPPAGPKE